MPRFDDDDFKKLQLCHQDLQAVFYEVVKHKPCKIIKLPELPSFTGLYNGIHVQPIDIDNQYFSGFVDGIVENLINSGKIQHKLKKMEPDFYGVIE
jgi:hypothetical protein